MTLISGPVAAAGQMSCGEFSDYYSRLVFGDAIERTSPIVDGQFAFSVEHLGEVYFDSQLGKWHAEMRLVAKRRSGAWVQPSDSFHAASLAGDLRLRIFLTNHSDETLQHALETHGARVFGRQQKKFDLLHEGRNCTVYSDGKGALLDDKTYYVLTALATDGLGVKDDKVVMSAENASCIVRSVMFRVGYEGSFAPDVYNNTTAKGGYWYYDTRAMIDLINFRIVRDMTRAPGTYRRIQLKEMLDDACRDFSQ